jgi:hypothetical protein
MVKTAMLYNATNSTPHLQAFNGLTKDNILFIDDTPDNVEIAAKYGFNSAPKVKPNDDKKGIHMLYDIFSTKSLDSLTLKDKIDIKNKLTVLDEPTFYKDFTIGYNSDKRIGKMNNNELLTSIKDHMHAQQTAFIKYKARLQ